MTEKQIKHYENSKLSFEKSKEKKTRNILRQRVGVSNKMKKLMKHFTKLKGDFENLQQLEFPPIEEYYQNSSNKSSEEVPLEPFSKDQLQEVLEYTSYFPIDDQD